MRDWRFTSKGDLKERDLQLPPSYWPSASATPLDRMVSGMKYNMPLLDTAAYSLVKSCFNMERVLTFRNLLVPLDLFHYQ